MRGTSILLLGVVALAVYGNALPYTKIPDGALLTDGYHYKKSSSNANSNSYSQSNHDDTEINGVFGGQAFSGSKSSGYNTNGGSHSESSSFSSGSFTGNVPFGLIGGSTGSSAVNYGALGNPGTGNLGLENIGAGSGSSSFSTSYGGAISGSDASSGNSGSFGSGANSGIKGGNSAASPGVFSSSGSGSFASGSASAGFGSSGSGLFGQSGSGQHSFGYGSNSGINGGNSGVSAGAIGSSGSGQGSYSSGSNSALSGGSSGGIGSSGTGSFGQFTSGQSSFGSGSGSNSGVNGGSAGVNAGAIGSSGSGQGSYGFGSSSGNNGGSAGGNAGAIGSSGTGSFGSSISGQGSYGSGSNSGIKGGNSASNSGVIGSSGSGSGSFGQSGSGQGSFGYGTNSGVNGGSAGAGSGVFGSSGSFGQSGSADKGSAGSTLFGTQTPSGSFGPQGATQGAVQYWWNGPNSPFGQNGKPIGGCTSNACSVSGVFDLTKGNGGAHASSEGGRVDLNIQGNPFLNKGAGGSGSSGVTVGYSGISSSGSGSSSRPISGNQFSNGDVSSGSFGAGSKGSSGSFATSNAGAVSSGSIGSGNPFLKPGSGAPQAPNGSPRPDITSGYPGSQGSGSVNFGSSNPFFKPGSGSVVLVPAVSTVTPIQSGNSNPFLKPGSVGPTAATPGYSGTTGYVIQTQQTQVSSQVPSFPSTQVPSFPTQQVTIQDSSFPSQSSTGSGSLGLPKIPGFESQQSFGGLTITCSGKGRICVAKNLCVNGKVITNGEGLIQVRTGDQECNVDSQVCCTLKGYSGASSDVGIVQGVDFGPSTSSGASGSFGSSSGTFSGSSSFGGSGSSNDQTSTSFGQSGQSGQFGSSGTFGQAGQEVTTNFGGHSTISNGFGSGVSSGSHSESGLVHVTPTGGPSLITVTGTPAPGAGLIHVTPSSGGLFDDKPTPGSFVGAGNTGFGSGSFANANAGASGQSFSGASSGASSGSINGVSTSSNGGISGNFQEQSNQNNGLFGSSNENAAEDLSAGDGVKGGSNFGIKESGYADSNGYLPPIGGDSSSNVPAFSRPPQEEEGGASNAVPNSKLPPRNPNNIPNPRPTPRPQNPNVVPNVRPQPQPSPFAPIAPQIGCAAALICVEDQFCTIDGVISPEPVALTAEQIERRVPLSTCKNPDNGIIGKCCRDPNYVDPWPTGNLPANYTGGFDEQGFPSYLNIAKTRPPKKPATGTKNRQPTKTFPNPNLNQPQRYPTNPPQIPNFPDQGNNGNTKVFLNNPFIRPTQKQQIPVFVPEVSGSPGVPVSPPKSLPGIPQNPPGLTNNFPGFPNIPNPFGKNYDSASSNQSPIVIAPHTPGSQCGLRNKVQRPNDLSDVDVAFGEIPWQAMILSTRDRKLLCSGAIVAPNAVLTAAHCVDGLRPNEVSIKSGEWKLGYELKHEEPLPFEIVKVVSIVSHPGYYSGGPSHDLAVLFLEHPLALDQHVDLLCLGNSPQPKPGRKCIATGWGKTVLQVNVAGALMHGIDVDLLSPNACKQRIQGAENQIDIDDTLVCAKAQKQSNNMCQVDVGGPMACDRGDGFYELTGLYSQDTGCLPTNQVATFALIDNDWVKKTLNSPIPVEVPSGFPEGESQSPSNVNPQIQPHEHVKQEPCDCQKSHLSPESNQYLPPL